MELRYITLLPLLTISLLSNSCHNVEQFSSIAEHEYSEVSDKIIEFNACFDMNNENYYVYFFSPFCGHCKKIKNTMIEFALRGLHPIYFVQYTEEIKIVNDASFTLGASSVTELAIIGVPTLINIEGKIVKSNIAGADKILKIIEPYLT